ncbi:MAG: DUF192 domain-containing protein [Chromatiales bacterium]|nr:DUF192 domain-containing protein [Chromatiales bacterium]
MRRTSLVAGLLLAWTHALAIGPAHLVSGMAEAVVVVETGAGLCVRVEVRVAETAEQRRQGLMFVESLSAYSGMLFLFDGEAVLSMWMQNTYVPLDMLFINADRSIASIARDTVPLSTRRISSGDAVAAVLEVNAGFSARKGIREGNRIQVWRGNGDMPRL